MAYLKNLIINAISGNLKARECLVRKNIPYSFLVKFLNENKEGGKLFELRPDLINKFYDKLMDSTDLDINIRSMIRQEIETLKSKNRNSLYGYDVIANIALVFFLLGLFTGVFLLIVCFDTYNQPVTLQSLESELMSNPKSADGFVFLKFRLNIDYGQSTLLAIEQQDWRMISRILNKTDSGVNATQVLINATTNGKINAELFDLLLDHKADLESDCWLNLINVMKVNPDAVTHRLGEFPYHKLEECSRHHSERQVNEFIIRRTFYNNISTLIGGINARLYDLVYRINILDMMIELVVIGTAYYLAQKYIF